MSDDNKPVGSCVVCGEYVPENEYMHKCKPAIDRAIDLTRLLMKMCEKPAPVKPRELWILCEEQSNRALTREHGEKWPDDIKGEPSERWLHAIEYSAYTELQADYESLLASRSLVKATSAMQPDVIKELEAELAAMTEERNINAHAAAAEASWLNEALEREALLLKGMTETECNCGTYSNNGELIDPGPCDRCKILEAHAKLLKGEK